MAKKKQRRRNRPQVKATHRQHTPEQSPPDPVTPTAAPEPEYVRYPSFERSLLEVAIEPGTPEGVAAMCRAYWEFTEPGTWARQVSALGSAHLVYKAVRDACTASLLTVVCPSCAAPVAVASRSEMAATGYWHPGGLPAKPVEFSGPCAECRAAAAAARKEDAARAQTAQDERSRQRAANAFTWLTEHKKRASWSEWPDAKESLVLLAMADIIVRSDTDAIGPLEKASYTLTGSLEGDSKMLKELYRMGWVAPTVPATVSNFDYNDDDSVAGVFIREVPWRLAYWLGEDGDEACAEAHALLTGELARDGGVPHVEYQVEAAEAAMVVAYLAGLLEHKYREAPIPESRLPEAYETAMQGLDAGFSLRQMLNIAWSATSRSAAWGARTEWIKPGMVSAAAVTNLGKGIGYAKDRGVPEYELPNWLAEPALLPAARRFLKKHGEAHWSLMTFRALHQRVAEAPAGPVDFHDELDSHQAWRGPDDLVTEWLKDLREGRPTKDDSPVLTYGLVMPDGTLEMATTTTSEMQWRVSSPGAGFVDRITIEATPALNAYVGELVPQTQEQANPVATEMLELLGDAGSMLFGPVSFFQVGLGSLRPGSLDADRQELVKAAHRAAASRVAAQD